MDNQKELPVDISESDLIATINGLRPEYSRSSALKVLSQLDATRAKQVMSEIVTDQKAPPDLRSIAAISLGHDITQEKTLRRALQETRDPVVLRRIAQSLGKVGGPDSLVALRDVRVKSGSRAATNIEFARSLISYRHGLKQYLVSRPAKADILAFDHKKSVSLNFAPLKPAEFKKELPMIKTLLPGIAITEKAASCFNCMNSRLWLILNEEMVGKQAEQRVQQANAVMAVVLKYEHCPEGWSVFEYILSNPNRDKSIDIVGVRPSGITTHFGQVKTDDREATVKLQSVNSVYALPMEFNAKYNVDKVALKVTEAISARTAVEGQRRPIAPKSG